MSMGEKKSHWVTKEQLDTPLCDIFKGTQTKGTARAYVRMSEIYLGLKPTHLDGMEFEEMNNYIDSLDERIEKML